MVTAKELITKLEEGEKVVEMFPLLEATNLISPGLYSHRKSAKTKEFKFLVMTGGYFRAGGLSRK